MHSIRRAAGGNLRLSTALLSTTGLSSALIVALATLGAAPAMAQDSCAMQGNACTVVKMGADAPSTPGPSGLDGSGNNGKPGQQADGINITLTDSTVYHENGITSPLQLQSQGGKGADGSSATSGGFDKNGGDGGNGGDAGTVTLVTGSNSGGTAATIASGITAFSTGGAGGQAARGNHSGSPGNSYGYGGAGNTINATIDGGWGSAQGAAVYIQSGGGKGGDGMDSSADGYSATSPAGADGGAANTVTATLKGQFEGTGTAGGQLGGTYIGSVGGAGGAGGPNAGYVGDEGGAGGDGGKAGNVTATLESGASVTNVNGTSSAGLWVQSLGGAAGAGGKASSAGYAGTGGDAGTATAIVNGTAVSTGDYAPGVWVQSIGGFGANGGNGAGWFFPNGGDGGGGGAANTVTVSGDGATITTGVPEDATDTTDGTNSSGVLAQSIGGGGGAGGKASGWDAVGGNGNKAQNGAQVTAGFTNTHITTYGFGSDGIAAQSIGGGGGKGGDGSGTGAGINMTIGGTGGAGGDGGSVYASSGAGNVITTANQHSTGMLLQSVGGGGGDGGAAYGQVESEEFGLQVSVGGSGGAGGKGGTVGLLNSAPTNSGRITTAGSDSFGILGQSIGGGGGRGGASTAKATTYGGDDDGSLSVSFAVGGSGGTGGAAGSVTLQNAGLVSTSGQGAVGMLGQAIGGGGGAGGDASSAATASDGGVNISASVALGGKGGAGGAGGDASLTNSGMIITTGESGDGMLVQSVGGGGGNGGSGDAKGNSGGDQSLSLTLGAGGAGGDCTANSQCNSGGNATAINSGAIITLGDSAAGIGAQSIGGGGGKGGGGAGSSSGSISVTNNTGGSGGQGGSTYGTGVVTVNNSGTLVTFGADSAGIIAQSIGGGGGIGGKSATSLGDKKSTGDGGNGDADSIAKTVAAINSSGNTWLDQYNSLNGAVQVANSLLGNTASLTQVRDDDDALDDLSGSGGETEDDNDATKIHMQLGVGGTGGTGGAAGAINITNTGDIGTAGKMSDGIIAQAIGGGGGKGGAASTATSDEDSGQLSVGGSGATGGNGGQPTVTNKGNIDTRGAESIGIVVQSIAGGGGMGGASASSISSNSKKSAALGEDEGGDDGQFKALAISVGGSGGASGQSGQAVVDNYGKITTTGHDSIGIVAQSIAGGGGIVKTLATDLDNAGGSATSSGQKDYDINLKFSGSSGGANGSGLVKVTTHAGGDIKTSGDDAYGILAQSIAGGGGLVLGGKPSNPDTPSTFFGSNKMVGSVINDGGNNSGLFVETGGNVTTTGDGATGIFAQSIGGGGGLAGDTGHTQLITSFGSAGSHEGSGGSINITVDAGSTISTSGNNADGMIIQSIGGGGGRVSTADYAFDGSAGGSGNSGPIDITVNGTVTAQGNASSGIYASSAPGKGGTGGKVSVTIGQGGTVSGGPLFNDNGMVTPAVWIDHGGATQATENVVTNNGTLTSQGGAQGIAVRSDYGYTHVVNNGSVTGSYSLNNNGGNGDVTNNVSGTMLLGGTVALGSGTLTNNGTLSIGAVNNVAATTISGNFVQGSTGTMLVDADLSTGKADQVTVNGTATIAGTVKVNPLKVSNRAASVLTATGGVTLDPALKTTDDAALYDFALKTQGNALQVQAKANFTSAAQGLGTSQQAVATNLQHLFDGGATMDAAFNALATVRQEDYAKNLTTMAGQALGAIGAFRYNTSRAFVGNLYNGCDSFDASGARTESASCGWARGFGTQSKQDATTDALGYKADAVGFQLGGQRQIGDNWYLSGALAYESSKFHDADHQARITGDGILGGVGLRYHNGPLEVSGALDAGYGWYSSKRDIAVGAAEDYAYAKPREWEVGGHLRGAYTVDLGKSAYVKPFADVHAIYVHGNGFTETGNSPFALDVADQGNLGLSGDLGAELGGTIKVGQNTWLRPFVSGAIQLSSNNDWESTARFANQPGSDPFTVSTAAPGTLGRFAVGAELLGSSRVDFSIQYSPEFGDHYTSHTGLAKITYHF